MGISARQAAFGILLKIERDKAYSNIALDSAVKAYGLDSTDCAFISNIVYGVTERKITLDYIISRYTAVKKKQKPELTVILRMGVYQLLFSDKIPESAAVNESVRLAKQNGCGYAAGFVNAVLRGAARDGFTLPDEMTSEKRISITYSAPEELVKFLVFHYGESDAVAFLNEALGRQRLFVRVNTLKTDDDSLAKLLNEENVRTEKTAYPGALEIYNSGAVYKLDAYKNGLFHVEDLSSQLCVRALDAKPGETVIDLCAAPGGKSFTIAEMMENKGRLLSCDLYDARAHLIAEGANRLGLDIIEPSVNDATVFNSDFPVADRVLCDVPCSGLGIIGKKPEIKYKKLDDIKELIPIQKKILETASGYVKVGGTLVYSTCSVNPNENRKVCDAFLSEHPEFESVKALPDFPVVKPEGNYITLMPHINYCDGFFIAKFIRR